MEHTPCHERGILGARTMRMTKLALGVVAACVCLTGVAHADDIGPPPSDCPPGARGASSHDGEFCVPHECTADADCGAGLVCRAGRLCVRTEEVQRSRHHGGGTYTRRTVGGTGSCDVCAAPAACVAGRYCQRPGSEAATTTATTATTTTTSTQQPMDHAVARGVDEDDGCRVGSGAPAGGVAAGVLVLGVAALASRRRRGRPA